MPYETFTNMVWRQAALNTNYLVVESIRIEESVVTEVLIVSIVDGAITVFVSVVIVVEESVDVVESASLLQAVKMAAIAKTENNFFIVFLVLD